MAVNLLDANVLVALAWPQHVHHGAARAWFVDIASHGWATAPVTGAGFLRISCNPRVVVDARTPQEAADFLTSLQAYGAWEFWSDDLRMAR